MEFGKTTEILDKWGADVIAEMVAILNSKGAKNLQKSIQHEIIEDAQYIQLTISMDEYGQWANTGRASGMFPPLQPIREWAKDRGIPQKAVYPIAKKIAEEGTKHSGKDFLKVFYTKFPEIKQQIAQEVISDYVEYFHRLIKQAK